MALGGNVTEPVLGQGHGVAPPPYTHRSENMAKRTSGSGKFLQRVDLPRKFDFLVFSAPAAPGWEQAGGSINHPIALTQITARDGWQPDGRVCILTGASGRANGFQGEDPVAACLVQLGRVE